MPRPTPEQAKFFANNNLALPPSRDTARALMQYIAFGNALYKTGYEQETPDERAGYLRLAQATWNGKRTIRYANDGDGTPIELSVFVYYISARTRNEMRTTLERQRSLQEIGLEVRMPDRFKAIIGING